MSLTLESIAMDRYEKETHVEFFVVGGILRGYQPRYRREIREKLRISLPQRENGRLFRPSHGV